MESQIAEAKLCCKDLNLNPHLGEELLLALLACNFEEWNRVEVQKLRVELRDRFGVNEYDFVALEDRCVEIRDRYWCS